MIYLCFRREIHWTALRKGFIGTPCFVSFRRVMVSASPADGQSLPALTKRNSLGALQMEKVTVLVRKTIEANGKRVTLFIRSTYSS